MGVYKGRRLLCDVSAPSGIRLSAWLVERDDGREVLYFLDGEACDSATWNEVAELLSRGLP